MLLRSFFRKLFLSPPSGLRQPKRNQVKLKALQLEDRLTPATITVTGFADVNGPLPPVAPATANTAPSLRVAIDQVNYGSDVSYTINLAAGTYTLGIGGANEQLNQTGDLDLRPQNAVNVTIKGLGLTAAATVIDGNGLDRVLEILPATTGVLNVTLSNLTVTGGSTSSQGGGIFFNDSDHGVGRATLNLDNAVVTNNLSNFYGGGIFAFLADVNVANQSTVSNNVATLGGGGILLGSGNLLVSASNITANTAGTFGGGVASGYTFPSNPAASITVTSALVGSVVVQSHIDDNSSGSGGGGIYDSNFNGVLTINNSTLNRNFVGASGSGGALNVLDHEISITNSTLSNNQAGQDGGALANNNPNGNQTEIVGTTMNNNKTGRDGGAINNAGTDTLEIHGSTFTSNVAGRDGGAVNDPVSTTHEVLNTTFTSNTAARNGGAVNIIASGNAATYTNVSFTNNTSGGAGGGINAPGGIRFDLTSGTFAGNTAVNSGGGVLADATAVTVLSTTFNDNHSTQGNGGGLNNGTTGTVANSSPSDILRVTDVTGTNNWAGTSGGGINSDAGTATAINTNLTGNRAVDGGGVNFEGDSLVYSGGKLDGNTATSTGGGINAVLTSSGDLTVQNATVQNNVAAAQGGGIAAIESPSSTAGNTSTSLLVTQSVVQNNRSAATGGGVYTTFVTNRIAVTTIQGNRATTGGGGVSFLTNGLTTPAQTLTVDKSLFYQNRAGGSGDGGGILANANAGSVLTVTNTTVDSNTAGGNGGGIANEGFTTANIIFSTITANLATKGGGLYNDVAPLIANTPKTFLANTIVALNTSSLGPVPVPGPLVPTQQMVQASNGMDLSGRFDNLAVGGSQGHNIIGIENGQAGLVDLSVSPLSFNKTGTYSSPLDVKLAPINNNGGTTMTRKLNAGSPAINSGFADFVVQALYPTDQRGFPNVRPVSDFVTGKHPDSGAYQTP